MPDLENTGEGKGRKVTHAYAHAFGYLVIFAIEGLNHVKTSNLEKVVEFNSNQASGKASEEFPCLARRKRTLWGLKLERFRSVPECGLATGVHLTSLTSAREPTRQRGCGGQHDSSATLEREFKGESLKFTVCPKELGGWKALRCRRGPGRQSRDRPGRRRAVSPDAETLPGHSASGAARVALTVDVVLSAPLGWLACRKAGPSSSCHPRSPAQTPALARGWKQTPVFAAQPGSSKHVAIDQKSRRSGWEKKDSYLESCFYS